MCEDETKRAIYVGECSRGLYRRNIEHLEGLRLKKKECPLFKHQEEVHKGLKMNWNNWKMTRTGSYTTPTSCQVAEGILISDEMQKEKESRCQAGLGEGGVTVLNSRGDFAQPGIVTTSIRRLAQDLKFSKIT